MRPKRPRAVDSRLIDLDTDPPHPPKRRRGSWSSKSPLPTSLPTSWDGGLAVQRSARPPPSRCCPGCVDLLSALSDEVLLRILSFLSHPHLLLAVAPVSRRFHRLAADSQLWKALYYARFVLPRALRIPGFRRGAGHRLHHQHAAWLQAPRWRRSSDGKGDEGARGVDWKRQYRLRHNWARGKCAVEELRVGADCAAGGGVDARGMLVKVVEGIAVTADDVAGLRAWDLRTRALIASSRLTRMAGECDSHGTGAEELGEKIECVAPTCIAVDDCELDNMVMRIALGFEDGSFGVWRLNIREGTLRRQYRHEKSSTGGLIGVALSHPYLLTATESVLVSLYTFDVPKTQPQDRLGDGKEVDQQTNELPRLQRTNHIQTSIAFSEHTSELQMAEDDKGRQDDKDLSPRQDCNSLQAPYLLTSLKSHTARTPLALSIRQTSTTTIASIAYTFSTRQGWSIGMQDLHVQPAAGGAAPEIAMTRLAYTAPFEAAAHRESTTPSPGMAATSSSSSSSSSSSASPPPRRAASPPEPGPTTLCYAHPYLLAALPDNTLVLHLATSGAGTLSLSAGMRLWGHTCGIADAEIGARGRAVSVSARGGEMRVWELEGGGRVGGGIVAKAAEPEAEENDGARWEERRNWVGFDDEMVIVLKERAEGGGESLMVYDFT